MTGTIAVLAEKPPLRRAGRLNVVIDGTKVGEVRQGELAEFAVEPGTHTLAVKAGPSRSNTLDVALAEGETYRAISFSTGLTWIHVVPLAGLVVGLFPGTYFRLRPPPPRPVPPAQPPDGRSEAGSGSAADGLWWESDPALAKRFRNETRTGRPGG